MNFIKRDLAKRIVRPAFIMFILLLAWGSINSAVTSAAVFYVSPSGSDSNPGTQSAPWRTMGKAAATMVAGDATLVQDGTYVQAEVEFHTSGTATQRITLKAQNPHQAILSSTSGCQPNISIYASYITIEDLRIKVDATDVLCPSHPTSADGNGIRAWGSNTPAKGGNESTGWVGVTIRNTWIDASSHRSHSIKTNQDNSLLENNRLDNGIESLNNNATVIRNNLIRGVDAWGNNLIIKGGARNQEVYNNLVTLTQNNGGGLILGGSTDNIYLWDPLSGFEVYNSVAYNNVVIDVTGGQNHVLAMRGCSNCTISNNVVIDGALSMFLSPFGTASLNPTWKNNVISGHGTAALESWTSTGTLIVDYNNFYNVTGAPSQAHAITGDPLFVDRTADWHLRTSSLSIGNGIVVSAIGYKNELIPVNKDKEGIVRTTPWDLGIYATKGGSVDTTPPAAPSNLSIVVP